MEKDCEIWKYIITVIGSVITLGFTVYIAVNGWKEAKVRDIENRKREIITSYLIEAYRNIENICGREGHTTEEQRKKGEQAIADVQLLGSSKHIKLAKEFAETMNKTSYGDPRMLLVELRNSLREALNLERASDDPNDIVHWRLLGDAPVR